MSKGLIISAFAAGAFLLLSAGAPAIAADSACKGLAKTKCEGASSCSWVKGYKTKEGKNVAAYCRTKGKGGAAAKDKAKDAKKSVSKKSDTVKKSAKSADKKKTEKTN